MPTQSPGERAKAPPLAGCVNWLTTPGAVVNGGVGLLLVYYCSQTMDLPPGSMLPLLGAVAIVTAVLVPLSFWIYGRVAPTLTAISRGRLPATPEHLASAARETRRFPDVQFWVVAAMWVLGSSSALPLLWLWLGLSSQTLARIAFNAFMLAPVGALLTYLMCTLRARALQDRLVALGLGADGLVAAAPPVRQTMRARLMVFSAILVVCPAVITGDLVLSLLTGGMEEVRAAELSADRTRLAAAAVETAVTSVLTLGGLLLLFALAIAYVGGSAIGRPLQALARQAKRLAAGEATGGVVPAEDELWAVSTAFHALRAQTAEVLGRLQNAGARIFGTTESLVTVARGTEDGANLQATALGATSATTEELAQAAQLIAGSAAEVAQAAAKTLEAARTGQASSRTFLEATDRLRRDNGEISSAVAALRERVERISQIVEFINGVADRADLLALNAELEGTKAGEIGRGFSLVAGEMRRMAEQVVRTTREIEAQIADVQAAAQRAAEATAEGERATEYGAGLAIELARRLDRILGLSDETARTAVAISQATGQQRSGAAELAGAMASVLRVTEDGLSATREMSSASEGLSALSQDLEKAMRVFGVRA